MSVASVHHPQALLLPSLPPWRQKVAGGSRKAATNSDDYQLVKIVGRVFPCMETYTHCHSHLRKEKCVRQVGCLFSKVEYRGKGRRW